MIRGSIILPPPAPSPPRLFPASKKDEDESVKAVAIPMLFRVCHVHKYMFCFSRHLSIKFHTCKEGTAPLGDARKAVQNPVIIRKITNRNIFPLPLLRVFVQPKTCVMW